MRIKIYGLVGYPLGHSFSRRFFNEKFSVENINAEYRNFELSDISHIGDVIESGVCGLNVTIPYKQTVMPFLSRLDSEASRIGSVNVIKIERQNGKISTVGYNTDVEGFCHSIAPHLLPRHRNALVLGTGGASKAVVYGLRKMGISPTLVSRTSGEGRLTYGELTPDIIRSHEVIVNTTPLGMFPHVDACPDIPYEHLSDNHLCFDLIYNPDMTLFLEKAKKQNADTVNGMEMLIGQALAAWKIWNE